MDLRTSLTRPKPDVVARFSLKDRASHKPYYNLGPGGLLPLITMSDPQRLVKMRWGLIPFDTMDSKAASKHIEARIETLVAKQPFVDLVPGKRCLIPVDGFVVWKDGLPFRVTEKHNRMMALAGLWEYWSDPEGEGVPNVTTCVLLSRPTTGAMAQLTDRCPVILHPDREHDWLHGKRTPQEALELIDGFDYERLVSHRVTTLVENPLFDRPDAVKNFEQPSPGETYSLF